MGGNCRGMLQVVLLLSALSGDNFKDNLCQHLIYYILHNFQMFLITPLGMMTQNNH